MLTLISALAKRPTAQFAQEEKTSNRVTREEITALFAEELG